MSNELSARGVRNQATYFVLWRQSDGETFIASTPGWELEVVAHWGNYVIAAIERDHASGGSGLYEADMPAALAAGIYNYALFARAGSSPAITDGPPIATGWINWTGTADVLSSLINGSVVLSSAGLDSILVETGLNARQALSIIGSAVAGLLSGVVVGPTTIVLTGLNNSTVRITLSVDGSGNRTAVTLTPPP